MNKKKRLTKSSTDVVLSGTLGGIAEYLGIDSTIVRVIYVLLLLFGLGSPILLYIVLALIIPRGDSKRSYGRYSQTGQTKQKRKDVTDSASDDHWNDF
ncbi:MAG: PspC domain-containing protein [Lactobacillales bacterium]|jgi:phage shock protein PspC (stress-responsive transcriptional regulator)|nr:PspC domain-containing protein [Lactobacillales bacterium]